MVAAEAFERLASEQVIRGDAPRRNALIIINPYATTVSDRLRHLVVFALQSRYDVEAIDTDSKGHALEIAREAAGKNYDLVIAFGGDGTVNEAANGLVGSDTALTCLPGGSTNVFCRALGIPNDIVEATEHLLMITDNWQPRTVDLGCVNGRYFTFTTGIGIDALVAQHADSHPTRKAKLGAYYFTSAAVLTFMRKMIKKLPQLEIEIDGELHQGVSVVTQNSSPYTYFNNRPLHVTAEQEVDSGTLSAILLKRINPIDAPMLATRLFLQGMPLHQHHSMESFPEVTEFTVRSVDGTPLPIQVDGDNIGEVMRADISIRPRALNIVA